MEHDGEVLAICVPDLDVPKTSSQSGGSAEKVQEHTSILLLAVGVIATDDGRMRC